jgi:type II secretion system protein C
MEALFKQYFWVVKGLGLAITAALAASVITTYIGTAYIYGEREQASAQGEGETEGADDEDDDDKPVASLLVGGSSGSSSSRPSPGDRNKLIQSLLAHNLFCPSCAPVEVPVAEDGGAINPITGEAESISGGIQPGEVQSTLPLRLVATMESSDPKFSYATLRDEETGGAGPYWPGDNLRPTAVLVSVERSYVHLRNGGALEYIELGVEPPKGAPKPVAAPSKKKADDEDAPKPAGAIEGAENAIKCDSENSCTIERAWLEGVLSNPASLAKQARVMPSVKDGETRGFKFYGIRPGSLPKLLNIKNGDLITSVNGTDLKSMDGAMSLYAKLRRANNLSVTIERKGETITKEITIQ